MLLLLKVVSAKKTAKARAWQRQRMSNDKDKVRDETRGSQGRSTDDIESSWRREQKMTTLYNETGRRPKLLVSRVQAGEKEAVTGLSFSRGFAEVKTGS